MPPKLVETMSLEETKALARLIDVNIEEGLHPDLLESDAGDSDE